MAKLFLAIVWLAAASVVGAMVATVYELKRSRPPAPQPISIERTPARQNHNPWARWSLTEHRSAHNMLVAHVETVHLDEAVAIAQQITGPVKTRYEEVLIYFHRPGRPDTLPPRRVQWTLKSGYVETVYE
ncbi:MAG: hypothetical protein H0T71_14005 [Acidobacteria bacterium]|nr:hypothetical protein [Acidobacteriota bacterium]